MALICCIVSRSSLSMTSPTRSLISSNLRLFTVYICFSSAIVYWLRALMPRPTFSIYCLRRSIALNWFRSNIFWTSESFSAERSRLTSSWLYRVLDSCTSTESTMRPIIASCLFLIVSILALSTSNDWIRFCRSDVFQLAASVYSSFWILSSNYWNESVNWAKMDCASRDRGFTS